MQMPRFAITDTPQMLPAACIFCPTSNREWYLDTFYHIEYHGRLYICCACLTEMAREAGFETSDTVALLRKRTVTLAENNKELMIEVMRLERNIDALMDRRSPSVSKLLTSSSLDGRPLEDVDVSPERAENLGTGTGKAIESSDDSTLGNIRSTNDDDKSAIAELRLF